MKSEENRSNPSGLHVAGGGGGGVGDGGRRWQAFVKKTKTNG